MAGEKGEEVRANGCVRPDEQPGPGPPLPPDGGYGWVIMFASFMCNVIVDGVCFSFGIFYLEFLSYYGESKGKTAWVGSVLNGMYLSMGPITSALANRFGCRAVTVAGSVLACAAYLLSTLSPNVSVLIFLYGGLGGMGFGLMYLPAIVMVGFYFEKRRAFATGVAVCGSGIGAFVFAPLCEKMLSVYDWKGATWIIAGIALNGVLMGALFRPLEENCQQNAASQQPLLERMKEEKRRQHLDSCVSATSQDQEEVTGLHDARNIQPSALEPKDLLKNRLKPSGASETVHANGVVKDVMVLQSLQNLTMCKAEAGGAHACPVSVSMDDLYLQQVETTRARQRRARDLTRPLYRKDIFYSGSIVNLAEYKSQPSMAEYVRSVTSMPAEGADGQAQGPVCKLLLACQGLGDSFTQMMDFSLLLNPVFAVYGLSCFLCMTGFFVPFIYLPDHALQEGLTREQGAFLLSIIGIANTVARVLTGLVSDRSWADCLLINNCALIIGGVATCLCPFCFNYGLLATYAAVFGSSIAVFVSLRSIIMVELLGLERLTNAFGLVTMCQGLSSFIGAPIAGSLFDATGDYSVSFYVAGGCLAMAGLICLPLRHIARWHHRRHNQQSQPVAEQDQITMLVTDENGTPVGV